MTDTRGQLGAWIRLGLLLNCFVLFAEPSELLSEVHNRMRPVSEHTLSDYFDLPTNVIAPTVLTGQEPTTTILDRWPTMRELMMFLQQSKEGRGTLHLLKLSVCTRCPVPPGSAGVILSCKGCHSIYGQHAEFCSGCTEAEQIEDWSNGLVHHVPQGEDSLPLSAAVVATAERVTKEHMGGHDFLYLHIRRTDLLEHWPQPEACRAPRAAALGAQVCLRAMQQRSPLVPRVVFVATDEPPGAWLDDLREQLRLEFPEQDVVFESDVPELAAAKAADNYYAYAILLGLRKKLTSFCDLNPHKWQQSTPLLSAACDAVQHDVKFPHPVWRLPPPPLQPPPPRVPPAQPEPGNPPNSPPDFPPISPPGPPAVPPKQPPGSPSGLGTPAVEWVLGLLLVGFGFLGLSLSVALLEWVNRQTPASTLIQRPYIKPARVACGVASSETPFTLDNEDDAESAVGDFEHLQLQQARTELWTRL